MRCERTQGGRRLLCFSSPFGYPLPPLPASNLFIFNGLQGSLTCKIVIINGLRPNSSI
jgi:hypothetical protein